MYSNKNYHQEGDQSIKQVLSGSGHSPKCVRNQRAFQWHSKPYGSF